VWWPLLLLPLALLALAWRLRQQWRAKELAAGRSGPQPARPAAGEGVV
jgi:hypothetical protein